MNLIKTFFQPLDASECRATLLLGIPIMASELVFALGPFFSTVFSAKLSTNALAAQGLVSTLFLTLCLFTWGTTSSVGVLVARHYGANQKQEAVHVLQNGLMLALLLSIPTSFILYFSTHLLTWSGQSPQVIALARPYFHAYIPGMLGLAFYAVMAEYLIGSSRSKVILWVSIVETPFNLFVQYGLVFGKFGLPHLDLNGLAWGISFTIWFTNLFMLLYVISISKGLWYKLSFTLKQTKELLRIGLPVGIMYVTETGFYIVVALLMGYINSHSLAADQVAAQFDGFFITLMWGLGQAITARVGQKIGARDLDKAKIASITGIQLGVIVILAVALLFWFFSGWIVQIDIPSNTSRAGSVFVLSTHFIQIAGFFVIVDTIRIMTTNALRAYKDTYYPMYVCFFAFWIIALLAGCLLAFPLKMQGNGLWWGLVIGNAVAAYLLLNRLYKKFKTVTLPATK